MFKNFGLRKIKILFLILFFVFSFSLLPIHRVEAQTTDFAHIAFQSGKFIFEKLVDVIKKVGSKVASGLYRSALSNAVNTLAYDTATWLGSGGRGQKPLFVTDFGKYAANLGDAAVGQFIESIGEDVFGVDICSPSLNAKVKIGLGLVDQQRPDSPDCTLSEIINNWSIKSTDPNFLKDFYNSIDPTGTDLGATVYVQNKAIKVEKEATDKASQYLEIFQGWISPTDAGGKDLWMPQTIENSDDLTWNIFGQNLLKDSGNALVDAAKVFTNQLALTAFQNQLKKIGKYGSSGSAYSGTYGGLISAEADPNSSGSAAVENIAREIINPSFATRGDYEILSELTVCSHIKDLPDSTTNCVIDERFSQAIEQKKTVREAIEKDLLNGSASFGFRINASGDPEEPNYLDGLPYRSMIILRKYRIIPVGWELAAEYIKNNSDDSAIANNATLEKMVSCYSENDSYGDFYASWCSGLVDPDWVLKAPQNYCGKEGYGPRIISEISVPQGQETITDQDTNGDGTIDSSDKPRQYTLPNKLTVSRLDDYCADEQSCIEENDDGSCRYYGYCEEEKREWRFDGESCEANYNSCETFRSSDGKSVSYLTNTLSFCSQSDVGCKKYAIPAKDSYVIAKENIDWAKTSGDIYLNGNAEVCDGEDSGCQALIRLAPEAGANILPDGSFESGNIGDNSASDNLVNGIWPINGYAEITNYVNGELSDSGNVLLVKNGPTQSGIRSFDHSSSAYASAMPDGFVFEPETSYTLSANIYIEYADRVVLSIGRNGGYQEEVEIKESGTWQRASVTINNNEEIAANQFTIYGYASGGAIFYVDDVKLEVGDKATSFSLYSQKGLVYEKILPVWLEGACYSNPSIEDYSIRTGAPDICYNYARKCSRGEVGCQGFTPAEGGFEIPAKITSDDICPSECSGYDTFIQAENNFNSPHTEYLIPSTADFCSAAEVSCEEFTNLDESSSGGENKEYYSYLRQCVKPDDPEAACADFYVWTGNGETGQQLSKISLQSEGGDVALTESDEGLCNAEIFKYSSDDPRYNPDCRQFYDQDGNITYHLYSKTISCTADCHPYRLSYKNYLEGVGTEAECLSIGYSASSLHWDSINGVCNYCVSGGTWDGEQGACVYNAYPEESYACSAEASGCGEYKGNTSNDSRTLLLSDFEEGKDGWSGGQQVKDAISGEYSYANNSYIPMEHNIGETVKQGSSYNISFIAKTIGGSSKVKIYLKNSFASQEFSADSITIKADFWRTYSVDLRALNHAPSADEKLIIEVDRTSYIDNINFSLISDNYYLLRNSWETPSSCDADVAGNPYPLYMLGCSAYNDRLGEAYYLHSFDHLCQDSAVGCEALIDTKNSSSYKAENYTKGSTNYSVPADEVIYAVYDKEKECDSASKGCELLGKVSGYEGENLFEAIYVINNPDKYNDILCSSEGVGCEKWTASEGEYYFVNPGEAVCEWRQAAGAGLNNGWGWFKKKVKRCNGEGNLCSSDSQCSSGESCILESADNPCPTSQFKTFGQGGLGNEVYQPTTDGNVSWVGVCEAASAGCTEYIDPVSDFAEEFIYNGNLSQDKDGNSVADGWNGSSDGYQEFSLEGNNLYILTVESEDNDFYAKIDLSSIDKPIYELLENNELSPGSDYLEVRSNKNKLFYIDRTIRFDNDNLFWVSNILINGKSSEISLKKAVIDYQITDQVDKTSCNGQASLSNGCIYFNERSIIGSSFNSLNAAAFVKYNFLSPINSNNSNVLIKVRPDRDCGSWLACKSYVENDDGTKTCYEVASCDRLDESGNCANFTVKEDSDKGNRTYGSKGKETAESIKNLSGYSKVGYEDYYQSFSIMPNNLYSFGDMKQVGYNVVLSNGSFELYNEDDYNDKGSLAQRVARPTGWNLSGGEAWTKGSADTSFTVVADPDTAAALSIEYPMVGASFLQYSLGNNNKYPLSEIGYVDPGVDYYLSFYLNTSKIYDANRNNSADAAVEILIKDGDTLIGSIKQEKLDGWIFNSKKFTGPDSGNIRLQLSGSDASGNAYIDDIKISPVLLAADGNDGKNSVYAAETCRLYPEEDSLSCEYYDENGSLHRGEYGYCLEYDRYPGDPNACLLWWPVERIQGTSLSSNNNSSGYSGRAPLYYCIGANASTTTVNGKELNYPNLSNILYEVEESLKLKINNKEVINVNENYHTDNNLSFPLSYGTNTIEVWFQADNAGTHDHTELRIIGDINYLDYEGNPMVKKFDIVDFFDQFISGERAKHSETKTLSDGGKLTVFYSCGDEDHDELVTVRFCDVRGAYGQQRYITNKDNDGCTESHLCNGGNDSMTLTYTFYIPELACNKIAQVVTPDGSNKAWSNRIKAAANYYLTCNSGMPISDVYGTYVSKSNRKNCYSTDESLSESNYSIPFGAIKVPEPDGEASESFKDDPFQWSSVIGKQEPLPYILPTGKSPYSAAEGHMGQLYNKNDLSSLFAQSYGVWSWDNNAKKYISDNEAGENWTSPLDWCSGNTRSSGEACAVAPEVYNIKGNNAVNPVLNRRGFINLTFNSRVDGEQLPLTSYEVDWGDGESLVISGLEESDRQNEDDPHSVSHAYEYWDLKTKDNNSELNDEMPTLVCYENPNRCSVKPRIKVRDNWGWCTEGREGVACPVDGVCVNSNRVTNGASCKSNYSSSMVLEEECSPQFPYCSDGFYEFPAAITIYEK